MQRRPRCVHTSFTVDAVSVVTRRLSLMYHFHGMQIGLLYIFDRTGGHASQGFKSTGTSTFVTGHSYPRRPVTPHFVRRIFAAPAARL